MPGDLKRVITAWNSSHFAPGCAGDLGLDRRAYRRRSAVERCVGWLKECRRVGTRFDRLAGSFMAFVRLAFIQRYLRLLDPSDRT